MNLTHKSYGVIGTQLAATNYADLIDFCQQLAQQPQCYAIEFVNTQVVTMRRHEPWFAELTGAFDFFIPDGMPLVWCLNLQGAKMKDRVYGPTFMRLFWPLADPRFTHYLLGGSAECGDKLRSSILRWNPAAKITGCCHSACQADGLLAGEDEHRVLSEVNELSPDFLWIGLGTPKQQAWVNRHKNLIKRGVILSVGFAFDVNAGMKSDAPLWLQRHGLTWLFRVATEPHRLWKRYLKYNSLFLFYLLWDGLRGRAFKAQSQTG